MNNYIQNKLDEFDNNKFFKILNIPVDNVYAEKDGLRFDLQEINIKEIIEQSLTDYHNHIVEIWDKYVYDTVEDKHFNRDWLKMHMKEFISLLQDTNQKE